MKIHSIFLGLLIAGLSSACLAQWQWLDKDGHKVFSDRAPSPDIPEKNILKRPGGTPRAAAEVKSDGASAAAPAPANSAPTVSALDKELEAKKKQVADAEAAKRKAAEEANTKAKIENCARAKQAKSTIDSGVRLSRTNAAGEPEIMDDSARAAESKRIQGVINSDCK